MEWRQFPVLFIVFVLVFSPVGLASAQDDQSPADGADTTDSGSTDNSGSDGGSAGDGSSGDTTDSTHDDITDTGSTDGSGEGDGTFDDRPDDFQERPPEDFQDRPPGDFDPARRCGEEGGRWDGNNCIFEDGRPPGNFDTRPPEHRPPQPPSGCRIESGEGFDKVVCEEMKCPPQEQEKQRCSKDGGRVQDHGRCAWTCEFGEKSNRGSGFFGSEQACQPPEELERSKMKCEENGGRVFDVFDRGCKSIQCDFGGHGSEDDIYGSCRGEVRIVDDREICVERGNSQRKYHEVEKVPEATELLDIAFKLEELKQALDGLVQKSDNLANYYAGRPQEDKFKRVAAMFDDAKFEVDDIRKDLRDRLNDLEREDISEIIDSIRYIKDVTIKDIVYVMLSDDEELPERRDREFDDEPEFSEEDEFSMRTCEAGLEFKPEGSRGPTVRLDGVDDQGRCVLEATEGDRSMVCKFDDWQKVMRRGPTPSDIDKSCEGELKEMMKQGPGGSSEEMMVQECLDRGFADTEDECKRMVRERGLGGQGSGGGFDEKAVEDCIRGGGSFEECTRGGSQNDFDRRPPEDFRQPPFDDREFDRPQDFRDRPPEDFRDRPPQNFNDRSPENFDERTSEPTGSESGLDGGETSGEPEGGSV